MTSFGLKMLGVALVGLGLGACSHAVHQPMMSGMDHGKSGCPMMAQMGKGGDQAAMPMAQGQMGADGKGQMMAQGGCPTTAGPMMMGKAPAPKAGDDHAEHHK